MSVQSNAAFLIVGRQRAQIIITPTLTTGSKCNIANVELRSEGGGVAVTLVERWDGAVPEHHPVVRGVDGNLVVLDPNLPVRVSRRDGVDEVGVQC